MKNIFIDGCLNIALFIENSNLPTTVLGLGQLDIINQLCLSVLIFQPSLFITQRLYLLGFLNSNIYFTFMDNVCSSVHDQAYSILSSPLCCISSLTVYQAENNSLLLCQFRPTWAFSIISYHSDPWDSCSDVLQRHNTWVCECLHNVLLQTGFQLTQQHLVTVWHTAWCSSSFVVITTIEHLPSTKSQYTELWSLFSFRNV